MNTIVGTVLHYYKGLMCLCHVGFLMDSLLLAFYIFSRVTHLCVTSYPMTSHGYTTMSIPFALLRNYVL